MPYKLYLLCERCAHCQVISSHSLIEILFQAFPIEKAALPDALRSWGLPPPPSKRSQVHASRPHHGSSSKSGRSNSDRKHPPGHKQTTQDASTAYFKQRQTPSATSHTTHSERILNSSTVYIGPPRRKTGRSGGKSSDGGGAENSTDIAKEMSSSHPETVNAEHSLINVLSNLSPSAQNAALISALSAIDGQNQGTPNPALVDALRQLLATANPKPPLPAPTSAITSTGVCRQERSSADDDIVILDKENVNPTAFKRRTDVKPIADVPSANRPAPLGNKQNSSSPISATATIPLRKRRLSDFMDERDRQHAVRNKVQGRADTATTQRYARPDSISTHLASSSSSTLRSASIPRFGPSNENSAPCVGIAYPATSPVRPPKRHGVPEWARTTTATQPRFSKETVENLKEKAAEPKGKKKERKRGNGSSSVSVRRRASDVGEGTSKEKTRAAMSLKLPEPVTASSSHYLPIFASDLSLPPSSPPPPSPNLTLPQTPQWQKDPQSVADYTESNEGYSLFTPTPKSWTTNASQRLSALLSSRSPLSSPRFVRSPGENRGDDTSGEPDTGTEELEFPPSSLPIASSDAEMDPSEDDRDAEFQHWAGLPPSSPPPPSPTLIPQEIEKNDENINDSNTTGTDLLGMTFDDLGCLFSGEGGQLSDVFAQFSDSNQQDGILQNQEATVDFDFTEFWQSVKPLVGEPEGEGGSPDFMGEIDHSKLAADVQALFSGCLM